MQKNPSEALTPSSQDNENSRVFARVLCRELSKSELNKVAGARNRTRECWDTQRHDSIFTALYCSND